MTTESRETSMATGLIKVSIPKNQSPQPPNSKERNRAMNWTKIPTNLLISRTPDNELVAIVKYQLLWADLEYQPTDEIALRYMTSKQLASVKQYLNDIETQVVSDIKSTVSHRGNQKMFYKKKQTLKQNADSQSDNQCDNQSVNHTDGADKIRLDKIKKEISDDISKKITEDTIFKAGGQLWTMPLQFRKLAKKYWTESEIREIEIGHSCHEDLVDLSINDLLQIYPPKSKKKTAEITNYGQYEYLHPQMDKWLDYKKSRGERYKTEQSLLICAKKLHELSGGNALQADAIVEQSIANNYAGLFPLKQAQQTVLRLSPRERQDMINKQKTEALLRELEKQGN